MIGKPSNVRFATPDDDSAVYALLVRMHLESPLARKLPYDAETVYGAIQLGTQNRGGIVGVVETPDHEIVGTIGLLLERWWWTRDTHFLQARWLFVRPNARRAAYERDLFGFAEWCRQRMAADMRQQGNDLPFLLEHSFAALDRVEARERLWRRWGRKIGAVFLSGL